MINLQDFISDYKSEIVSALISSIITLIVLVFVIGSKKIKWLAMEVLKIYSNEKSWISKKRLESSVAFAIAENGALFWIYNKYNSMDTMDFVMWAGIQLTIAGWYVNSIQKEKIAASGNGTNNTNNTNNDDSPTNTAP